MFIYGMNKRYLRQDKVLSLKEKKTSITTRELIVNSDLHEE